jgi:hypothetical protein
VTATLNGAQLNAAPDADRSAIVPSAILFSHAVGAGERQAVGRTGGSTKHEPFVAQATKKDAALDDLARRIDDSPHLDYAVLLAHVFLADQLADLLGLRLKTDSLPTRLPEFEMVMNLALAGTRFEEDRRALTALNEARNRAAHRIDRQSFSTKVERFTELVWVEEPSGRHTFDWPIDDSGRIAVFLRSFRTVVQRVYDYQSEYQVHFPGA